MYIKLIKESDSGGFDPRVEATFCPWIVCFLSENIELSMALWWFFFLLHKTHSWSPCPPLLRTSASLLFPLSNGGRSCHFCPTQRVSLTHLALPNRHKTVLISIIIIQYDYNPEIPPHRLGVHNKRNFFCMAVQNPFDDPKNHPLWHLPNNWCTCYFVRVAICSIAYAKETDWDAWVCCFLRCLMPHLGSARHMVGVVTVKKVTERTSSLFRLRFIPSLFLDIVSVGMIWGESN